MTETHHNERFTVLAAATTAFLMVGHLQAGKTVRDALFLSVFDVTDLPKMMIASAVLSAAAVLFFSRILTRYGPARLTPLMYAGSALASVVEWVGMAVWPATVTVILYLHITVFDSLLISGFWSMISERYDPYTAKRVISRMATFTALGGLIGAAAANGVAKVVDTRAIIFMLALMHAVAGIALYQVARGQTGGQRQSAPPGGLFTILKRNTLIQRMALLILALSTIVALLDYLLKATLQVSLSKAELVSFFSYFYIGIGIGTLLLQTAVGGKALRWLGIGGPMAVLPLTAIGGAALALAVRHLVTFTLMRGGATLLANSFFKSGFESLFTPIAPADKRASKVLIDVGAARSGDMLGSFLIMGILLLPGSTDTYLLTATIGLAGIMLVLILLLHRGYLSQLSANLISGSLKPEDVKTDDAATRNVVALTQVNLQRDQLLAHISSSRKQQQPSMIPTERPDDNSSPAMVLDSSDDDPLIQSIRDLRSQDDERIRQVLIRATITAELVPHILPLLSRQEVLAEALNAAKRVASAASGQMADALLDPRQHPLVRRRIPLLLERADTRRAALGLTYGLEDTELDVRFRCAQALRRIKQHHPRLALETDRLWQAVYREIARIQTSGHQASHGVRPLHFLFVLLGVIYNASVMDICYDALGDDDPQIRGTALEYLENQLPQDVRTPLWPLITADDALPRFKRSENEIKQELLKAVPRLKKKPPKSEED